MDYDVYWYDDEQTIVCAKYPDNWTWTDFYQIRERVHVLVDSGYSPRVDFVADMMTAQMPKGSPFIHASTITRDKHPRVRFIVIASRQPIIRTMVQISSRLSPQNRSSYRLVDTVADAVALIHTDREREQLSA